MAITNKHTCVVHQNLINSSLRFKRPQYKSAEDTSLHQLAMAHCMHCMSVALFHTSMGYHQTPDSPDIMMIGTVEPYSCPIKCMINTQINIHNGRLLHLTSASTSMTAPVCHVPQCSHANMKIGIQPLTSVSSTMATRSPKTLLYAVSSSMPVQTNIAHVKARSTGMHATRQP